MVKKILLFPVFILTILGLLIYFITSSNMKITSTAFESGTSIPSKYTCDGESISPPLKIEGTPEETKTLVLISDDPDAPNGDWVHWTVFNIPANTTEIAENSKPEGTQGTTSFETTGYGAPCPPSGTHRYYFKIYALDIELDLDSSALKEDIEKAMEGHILDKAELMGKYAR